jgi:hypothetical protein
MASDGLSKDVQNLLANPGDVKDAIRLMEEDAAKHEARAQATRGEMTRKAGLEHIKGLERNDIKALLLHSGRLHEETDRTRFAVADHVASNFRLHLEAQKGEDERPESRLESIAVLERRARGTKKALEERRRQIAYREGHPDVVLDGGERVKQFVTEADRIGLAKAEGLHSAFAAHLGLQKAAFVNDLAQQGVREPERVLDEALKMFEAKEKFRDREPVSRTEAPQEVLLPPGPARGPIRSGQPSPGH